MEFKILRTIDEKYTEVIEIDCSIGFIEDVAEKMIKTEKESPLMFKLYVSGEQYTGDNYTCYASLGSGFGDIEELLENLGFYNESIHYNIMLKFIYMMQRDNIVNRETVLTEEFEDDWY